MLKTKFISSESTTSFCFSELCFKIKEEMKKKLVELSNSQIQEICPAITLDQLKERDTILDFEIINQMVQRSLRKFVLNDQTFEYSFRKNHLGGYRWYVLCPKCRNPCLKLYLPNNYKDREQIYLCKKCHNLKNSSSLLGATSRYKKVIKPLKRLEAIKAILLKTKMSSDKAKVLLLEYEQIERELAASPEFRLWEFQKKYCNPSSNKI